MKYVIANIITGCRIVASLIMIHFPVFSVGFYICYLLAGLTDMVDGTIARKLGAESEFGEKFDTIADFIFLIIALWKLVPEIELSVGIWIWIAVIAMIKIANVISGYMSEKKLVTFHSVTNKITGFCLFILPLTFSIIDIKYSSVAVCLFATFAAVQEGHFIRTKL